MPQEQEMSGITAPRYSDRWLAGRVLSEAMMEGAVEGEGCACGYKRPRDPPTLPRQRARWRERRVARMFSVFLNALKGRAATNTSSRPRGDKAMGRVSHRPGTRKLPATRNADEKPLRSCYKGPISRPSRPACLLLILSAHHNNIQTPFTQRHLSLSVHRNTPGYDWKQHRTCLPVLTSSRQRWSSPSSPSWDSRSWSRSTRIWNWRT